MKRKIALVSLIICLTICLVGLVACKPSEQPTTGLQDYNVNDSKIDTTLSCDIAETTEAFYIGSSGISKVEVDGVEVDSNEYIVNNNYLLMPEGWYESLGVGNHVCKVTYKTKTLEFKFIISDNKALVYEMPNLNNTYVPLDKAQLPLVEFKYPSQEKEVTYNVKDSEGKNVEFSIENDAMLITDPVDGEYTYSVVATRNGQTVIDENYSFKLVSREFYDGLIDPTNGEDHLDMWYVISKENNFGYRDFTDANGQTRSALYFERNSIMDDHTRAIGIDRNKLYELLTLGYTKIGFWYCVDFVNPDPNIHIHAYRAGTTWAANEISAVNVWTYKELDIANFVTADMLLNDDSSQFAVGFATQYYNYTTQKNLPLTVYFSEVVALNREGDASDYLGKYTCENESIVLSEDGVATFNGQTCSYWVNNNYLVIDKGNQDYTSYIIGCGVIYDVKSNTVFKNASYEMNVDANSKIELSEITKCFVYNGIECSAFVKENGVDDGVADTQFVFDINKTYTIKVVFGGLENEFTVTPSLPTTTGNIATTLRSSGKVSCYLANNQSTGQVFHYGEENWLYFNCFNSSLQNAMIFDDDFIKECFANGLTCIKATYLCSNVGSDAWIKIAPSLYDTKTDTFTEFACVENTELLEKGKTFTVTWQLTQQEVQSIDFENGFRFAISGLGASQKEKTQICFSYFEFCVPENN